MLTLLLTLRRVDVMVNAWSLLDSVLKGTLDEDFPIMKKIDKDVIVLGGEENIRDFIAFPKNNSGKDVMINSPSTIDPLQLNELNISLKN